MSNDSITQILTLAEALQSISSLLPEEEAGIALMIRLMAEHLKEHGEALSDEVPPISPHIAK